MTESFSPHVLRDYSLIADGERGALIGPDGAIAWLCAPRWDSPSVFGGLLGGRGTYAVTPADPWHVWGGYYESGTLIWRSRWVGSSRTECREALAMPADPHRAVILRRIVAVDGPARVNVVLDVRAGFGRSPMTDLSRADGCWTGRSGRLRFRWSGAARARPGADGLAFTVTLPAGGQHDLVLELSDRPLPTPPPDPDRTWAATEAAWADVVPACDDLTAARDTRHAYAVLRGLTAGSGAMVAAATTSLPEHLEGGRNYDYRYAWIRDQCYAGLAVAAHGAHPLLEGTVRFVTERLLADGPGLMPAYRVTGESIPGERALRLPGYPGGTARAGNRVTAQFQLDGLGEALELFAAAARLDLLAEENWQAAAVAAEAIEKRWTEPDAGIWELEDRHWTHSRLACVSGLRSLAAAASGPPGGPGTGRRPGGVRWPTRCWPASATRSTRPAAGSARPMTAASTPRCCCRSSAAPCPRTTRAAARRSGRSGTSSPRTGTCTGSGTTPGRCTRARARSCCAGSGWRRSRRPAGTPPRRPAGSSATARPAARPACTPRSTTSASASRGATCPRRSCTPGCWNAPSACPPRRPTSAPSRTHPGPFIHKDLKGDERSVVLWSGPGGGAVPEVGFPVEVVEGVPVVRAPEEIDIANAGGLKAALLEAVGLEATGLEAAEPGRALVVVDMSRTRFSDSAGLNALVAVARQARAEGGEVRLVVAGGAVARLMALTGVDRVIPVYASLEDALS
jgi:alpha,alpha-trehalase